LNPQNDGVHTRTQHYRQRTRQQSSNLQTQDVEGAQPRVWAKKEVNRPNF